MRSTSNGSTKTLPTPEKAMAALADDLSAVKSDVATLVKSGRRHLSTHASSIADRAAHSARDLADRTRRSAEKTRDGVAEFASERPFTTIAISALGGMVLAGLISRRMHR